MTNSLEDVFSLKDVMIPTIRTLSDYRKSLYTKVMYSGFHCDTEKGHVVTLKQYRKDFYKPRNWTQEPESFFAIEEMISERRLKESIEDDNLKFLVESLIELNKQGYVLNKWNLVERHTYHFVNTPNLEYLERLKNNNTLILFPGHLQTCKYNTPQYEDHKEIYYDSIGSFYPQSFYRNEYVQDEDYRDFDSREIPKIISKEIIAEDDYNVLIDEVVIDGEIENL